MRERGHRTVDLSADAVVAHLGVNGIGKVERRGAGTKRHDLALGRKDEDLLIEQIDLQRMQVFLASVISSDAAQSSECLSQLIWSSKRWASLVLDADDPPDFL